jgi:Membrane dipeptidase (Peptidase family M19)
MFHLWKQGERYPVLNVTVPRLKRANISTTFYAVCGDSLTHVRGTYRYLNSALENIDALREEIATSCGQMKLICYQEDIPSAPTTDTVHFVLSFEGGRPLEGRTRIARAQRKRLDLHPDYINRCRSSSDLIVAHCYHGSADMRAAQPTGDYDREYR